jgi:ADP-ribose pyrophosphatase YjhB (NUDIX family)
MEIPRNWRLRKIRYGEPKTWGKAMSLMGEFPELSLDRAMHLADQEQQHELQVGVMWWIDNGKGKVFVVADEPKTEMAGSMREPVKLTGLPVYNLPAGAREYDESVVEVARREFREEVGFNLPAEAALELVDRRPFVVSQFDRRDGAVVQFGAWLVSLNASGYPGLEKRLNDLAEEGKGKWVEAEELAALYRQVEEDGGDLLRTYTDLGFRPQTLTAAMLWRGGKAAQSALGENADLIDRTKTLADQMGRERMNGVFANDGSVAPEAWLPVQAFLGRLE